MNTSALKSLLVSFSKCKYTKELRDWYNVGVLSFCSILELLLQIEADLPEIQPDLGLIMRDSSAFRQNAILFLLLFRATGRAIDHSTAVFPAKNEYPWYIVTLCTLYIVHSVTIWFCVLCSFGECCPWSSAKFSGVVPKTQDRLRIRDMNWASGRDQYGKENLDHKCRS